MPFKSQAQRRKFAEMLIKGEISAETFEEWNRETGGRKLPERVEPAAKGGKKRKMTPRPGGRKKAKPASRTRASRKSR